MFERTLTLVPAPADAGMTAEYVRTQDVEDTGEVVMPRKAEYSPVSMVYWKSTCMEYIRRFSMRPVSLDPCRHN